MSIQAERIVGSTRAGQRPLLMGLFWSGLAIYTLVLPVPHSIALRNFGFLLLILASAWMALALRKRPALPLAGYWTIYGCVALLSLTYALFPQIALSEFRVEIIYCAVIFMIAFSWAEHFDILKRFALLAAAANLILISAAMAHVNFDTPMASLRSLPPLALAGVNATWLVTLIPLLGWLSHALWTRARHLPAVAIAALIVLDVVGMILSHNRQGLIALAAALLCGGILVLKNRFTLKRCGALMAVLLILASLTLGQMVRRSSQPNDIGTLTRVAVTQDVRWTLWKFSIERIAGRPWSGGGFGRGVFNKLYPKFMPEQNKLLWHAHNMVLNKGIQMGIPGMLAFLLLWFALARAFARHLGHDPHRRGIAIAGLSTLTAVFVKNMTDDFFIRDLALWFWLIIGVLLGSLSHLQAISASRAPRDQLA